MTYTIKQIMPAPEGRIVSLYDDSRDTRKLPVREPLLALALVEDHETGQTRIEPVFRNSEGEIVVHTQHVAEMRTLPEWVKSAYMIEDAD